MEFVVLGGKENLVEVPTDAGSIVTVILCISFQVLLKSFGKDHLTKNNLPKLNHLVRVCCLIETVVFFSINYMNNFGYPYSTRTVFIFNLKVAVLFIIGLFQKLQRVKYQVLCLFLLPQDRQAGTEKSVLSPSVWHTLMCWPVMADDTMSHISLQWSTLVFLFQCIEADCVHSVCKIKNYYHVQNYACMHQFLPKFVFLSFFCLSGELVYTLLAYQKETNSSNNIIYGFNNRRNGDLSIDTESTYFRIDSETGNIYTFGNKLDYEVELCSIVELCFAERKAAVWQGIQTIFFSRKIIKRRVPSDMGVMVFTPKIFK